MRFFGRLVLLFVGLLFAIPTAAVTLAIGAMFEPATYQIVAFIGAGMYDLLFNGPIDDAQAQEAVLGLLAGFWTLSIVVLIAPVTFVAIAGEATGARSFVYYAGLTAVITAAAPWLLRGGFTAGPALAAEGRITALLFVTGAVAGLVYWFCAGRSAGRKRPDPRVAQTQ
ncbi:MAG: hypothetical protein EA385_11240 [Salinarimonadaceae bacterium]|nr:MAG: hypothetical protein EA385_11240 [Salinarimonadaceae bacterium]